MPASTETYSSSERDQIGASLERLLASQDFDASDRNRSFLRFVVNETLAGRSDRIKAYTIATDVFRRHPTFDAQTDPIVRIEARRLRRSLERYYFMEGRAEPVVIGMPKGGYVPTFTFSQPPSVSTVAERVPPVTTGQQTRCPSILVAAFEVEGVRPTTAIDGSAFARKLIVALTRFSNVTVFGDTAQQGGAAECDRPDAMDVQADYVLSGGIGFEATRFTADVMLTERKNRRCVWAELHERPMKNRSFGEVTDDVANAIARTLAQPHGIIVSRRIHESLNKPIAQYTAYDAVLRFYKYWQTYDRESHELVRQGLERAIVAEPDFAEAYSCLSMVLSDAFRFGYDQGRYSFDARARALSLAQKAVELAPDSSRAYQALSLARWFLNDLEASFAALEIGFALNPNDTDIMAELGFRYALLMDWERGVPLIERAFALNPLQRSNVRVALALYHYMHGRYEKALTEARRVDAPNVPYGHVMVAVAAARLGLTDEAEVALAHLLDLDPCYGEHLEADLARRNVHPGAIASIRDGLHYAGLVAHPDGVGRKRRPRLAPRPIGPPSA